MAEINVIGFVKRVDAEETQVSQSFTKRELVVATEEQYPQYISINFVQGKCNNELDQLKEGEKVSVSINLRGREWINPQGEAKYFNDIQGWRVSKITGQAAAPAPAAAAPQPAAQAASQNINPDNTSDDAEF